MQIDKTKGGVSKWQSCDVEGILLCLPQDALETRFIFHFLNEMLVILCYLGQIVLWKYVQDSKLMIIDNVDKLND